jgi:phospholipid transport system substrate-binding protein
MTRPHASATAVPNRTTPAALSRRRAMLAVGAGALAIATMRPADLTAQSPNAAAALVNRVTADVIGVINSGSGESAMLREFERIFRDYADMPTIAATVLGPQARSTSASDMGAFRQAFQGYMARKYGRRFREFIGGQIDVTGTRQTERFVEVRSQVRIPGSAPFVIDWRVWDRSGRPLFIDIIIEGVSLVRTESTEIRTMLDARGGSVSRLASDLRALG